MKMEKITKMLFDGGLHAFETTVPQGTGYQALQGRFGELKEYIRERLPKEDAELFEEWDGLRLDIATIDGYTFFDYGFCLGLRMAAEAFCGMDVNQRDEWTEVKPPLDFGCGESGANDNG